MMPLSQTLFSLTLFMALSSLLAWSNRRDRSRQLAEAVVGSFVSSDRSAN